MTCETALKRILEADPEELTGDRPSPLGEHLASCGRCRALAEEVLEGQAALAAALEAVRPRTGVEQLPATGAVEGGDEGDGARMRRGDGRPRRPWRWTALPLAAAAVVAGLLVLDVGRDGGPVVVTPAESARTGAFRRESVSTHAHRRPVGASSVVPRPPRVAAPSARRVTVMATSNPKISVVWIEGESE